METKMVIEKRTEIRELGKEVKDEDSYISNLANVTGILVSGSFIAYFFIMKFFNLHEVLIFRYLNFAFLLSGIIIAFGQYKKKYALEGIDYLPGLKIGFQISLVAVIPFAIFMAIYLNIDTAFMEYIKKHAFLGSFLTPGIAAISVLMEGVASGAILTFILMQYFKEK